jgi:hypothetical protein
MFIVNEVITSKLKINQIGKASSTDGYDLKNIWKVLPGKP